MVQGMYWLCWTGEEHIIFNHVDSGTKGSEVNRCNKPTAKAATKFLYELFAQYSVLDTLVSDNGIQFTGSKFKNFYKILVIENIFTLSNHHQMGK